MASAASGVIIPFGVRRKPAIVEGEVALKRSVLDPPLKGSIPPEAIV